MSNSSWLAGSLHRLPPTNHSNAWIYATARQRRFSLSAGVNLNHFPKRRLGSSFHFQVQKSKFHLWVLQITKLLYLKLCIRSFLQTGTNLGNRAVLHDKSLNVCGWVLIMTQLWQFTWQYVSSKAYGFIIYNLHMIYMHPYTCIFSLSQKKSHKLYGL